MFAITALLLVFSALYLSHSLHQSTGKKQNRCLIICHFACLILNTSILIARAIFAYKSTYAETDLDNQKFKFHFTVSNCLCDIIDIFTDLFLLWMLYKFIKPKDSNTENYNNITAVLFVQNQHTAEEILKESFIERHDQQKARMIKEQTDNFIRYVIKECAQELKTQ